MGSMHGSVDRRASAGVGQSARYMKQHSMAHGSLASDQCARTAAPRLEPDVLALLRNAPAFGRCVWAVSNGAIDSTVAGRVVRVACDGDDVVLVGSLFETRVSLAACASSHLFADPVTGRVFLQLHDQDGESLLQVAPLSTSGSLALLRDASGLADGVTSDVNRDHFASRASPLSESSFCAAHEAAGAISCLSLALPLAFGVRRQGAQQLFRGMLTRVRGTVPIVIVSGTCCTLHVDCRAIRSMDLQINQRGRSRSERIVLRDSQSTGLGWIEPVGNPDAWEIFIGSAGCRRTASDAGVLQTRSSNRDRQGNTDRLDTQSSTAIRSSAWRPSPCCNR